MILPKIFRVLLLALLAALVITIVFVGKGPLQDVHWDAPIYLSRGKLAAETSFLHDYRQQAKETAATLPQFKVGDFTPYWSFIRLGNTLVLGAVTAVMGASLASLQAAFWLYTFLFACGLVCAVLLSLRIIENLGGDLPRQAVITGALLSAASYLASDVYRHLSGNLVAEIPAMFLLTAGALALVEAASSRRISLAILSGMLGFALYVVKMDAIWVYISFALVYAMILARHAPARMYWPAFVTAGLVALCLYGAYAWWFWPLADPQLILVFAEAHRGQPSSAVAPIKLWFVAGGLLWLGLLLALRYRVRHPVLWLALGWLGMIMLPYYKSILFGGTAQVRMLALIMPSLLLASTLGWASLLERITANRVQKWVLPSLLACALVLIGLSHAEPYQWLRHLPGGWRLQYVKEYLSPPRYERMSYPVEELAMISRFLYRDQQPTVVIFEEGRLVEYLNIIAYLGPPLPPIDHLVKGEPLGKCGNKTLRPDVDQVMFCTVPPSLETIHSLAGQVRILRLRSLGDTGDSEPLLQEQAVFETQSLVLSAWPSA